MGIETNSAHCNSCGEQRKIERKTANHILHLLITIILGVFTAGIGAVVWLVIWVLLSINIGGWRCSICGSKDVKKVL